MIVVCVTIGFFDLAFIDVIILVISHFFQYINKYVSYGCTFDIMVDYKLFCQNTNTLLLPAISQHLKS